ncbi:MAG: SIMPL domain-containing protein [Candidatus Nanopelagicales bacterium]
MADITIEVRGAAHTTVAPERATVHAAVTFDGAEATQVKTQVSHAVQRVREGLEHLQWRGALEGFSVDRVQVSAHRPWNEQGEQLPLIHTASVGIRATFTDFSEVGAVALAEDLTVHDIEWHLTPATRAQVERDTRQAALRDAVVRAQDYADTLNLGTVQVRSVQDPGPAQHAPMMRAAAMAEATLDLAPAAIEIEAQVLASFTA